MNRQQGSSGHERRNEGQGSESQPYDRGEQDDPRDPERRGGRLPRPRPHFEYGDRDPGGEPYVGDAPPWTDPRNPDYGSSEQPFDGHGARGASASRPRWSGGYGNTGGSIGNPNGSAGQWRAGPPPHWDSPNYGDFTPFQGLTSDRGTHSGKAPKGYKRADDRIHDDVCDRLTDHDVDVSDVEVKVANGEVTLTGTVTDRECKFRAERIAGSVSGVSDVQNQIKVRRDGARSNEAGSGSGGAVTTGR